MAEGTVNDNDVARKQVAEDAARNQRMMLSMRGVEIDGRRYKACGKLDCERLVPEGTEYCCGPCTVAAGHAHEIDGHSPGCDGRWRDREPLVKKAIEAGAWW
jgi:hypothetical protein